jgi:hypothetical protein
LEKAARIDHAVDLVERREARGRLHLQIAGDVILYDREVVTLGGLQYLERHMQAHVRPLRVLHHGLGEINLRPVCGGQVLENADVRSVGIAWHNQHFDTLQAQIAEQIVVEARSQSSLSRRRPAAADPGQSV